MKTCEEVMTFHNQVDEEYFDLLRLIIEEGTWKKNRTGIDTLGVFGAQAKFQVDLDAFPILTTKKVWFKGIVHELLWFLRGDTNIKYLVDNDVHIWDEWAYKRYTDTPDNQMAPDDWYHIYGDKHTGRRHTFEEFVKAIKELPADHRVVKKWGELGMGTYGGMWRDFPFLTSTEEGHYPKGEKEGIKGDYCDNFFVGGVDQITLVLNKLKTNPDDRRMIVSAWHPYWSEKCSLAPCHCMFHFNTEELAVNERWEVALRTPTFTEGWVMESKEVRPCDDDLTRLMDTFDIPKRRLNLLLYQRSCDVFLGVPFNITSYCLLLAMVAHVVGMETGVFTHTYGDLHIYRNHMQQVDLQMGRLPKLLPKLWLNPDIKNLFDFKFEDIKIIGYEPHPAIKAEVAV